MVSQMEEFTSSLTPTLKERPRSSLIPLKCGEAVRQTAISRFTR
jgi:hypothetical protein